MPSQYWGSLVTNELGWVVLKGMLIGFLALILFWAVVELSNWGISTLRNRGAKSSGRLRVIQAQGGVASLLRNPPEKL